MSTASVAVSQEIPFPGKRSLMEKMAGEEAAREEAEYRAVEWRVISELKRTYYELYLSEKSIETIQQAKKLLEQFAKNTQSRYAVGEGIQQDVLRAQVELSRFLERLILLEQQEATYQALINRLLNRPRGTPVGRPVEPGPPGSVPAMEELEGLVLEKAPMLRGAKKTIGVLEAALRLSRKQYYPDLELSAGYFNRGDFPAMYEGMVGVRVPLYFWRKQHLEVQAARSDFSGAEKAYEDTRQALFYQVKELFLEAQAALQRSDLLEHGIIPQATLSLESARAGYEVGKVDFLTLLDNLVALLEDRLDYHKEHVSFLKAMVSLEEVIGAPLVSDLAGQKGGG